MTLSEVSCAGHGHPLVTYNPHLNSTWCRCGHRAEAGEYPVDWDAKWQRWHDHPTDAPCDCYVRGAS